RTACRRNNIARNGDCLPTIRWSRRLMPHNDRSSQKQLVWAAPAPRASAARSLELGDLRLRFRPLCFRRCSRDISKSYALIAVEGRGGFGDQAINELSPGRRGLAQFSDVDIACAQQHRVSGDFVEGQARAQVVALPDEKRLP